MAQLLTIRLVRHDSSTPWGFRLQGGKDFGTLLLIQKVNMGSLAERAGLQVGDALIRVNNQDVADQRHKDAQDIIVRAGNSVEMAIQRGALSTWKPSVTPIGSTPSPSPYTPSAPSPVTKTSLAATNKNPSPKIGAAYNNVSKPYSPQMNGGYSSDNGSVKSIVNKQYNTPVGIYSDESIAETLSAQAEVLAGGVLGVNFKKNEKNYNAERSEVFKMVQEVDKEPKSPEPDTTYNGSSNIITQSLPVAGLRHVSAPQTKSINDSTTPSLPPGQNICADCERLIVVLYFSTTSHAIGGRATSRPHTPAGGSSMTTLSPFRSNTNSPIPNRLPHSNVNASTVVMPEPLLHCTECRQVITGVFVRIKDKNLHVECFKCATCGTSLKNVGYYSINNKLYCDIHAKLIARQNPPAPNLEPVTVPPPPSSTTFGSPKLSPSVPAPLSPQTIAPVPFHTPRQAPTHVPAPHIQNQQHVVNNVNSSKPVANSISNNYTATFSTPKPENTNTDYSVASTSSSYSCSSATVSVPYSSKQRLPFLKPRDDKVSAFMPVMKSEASTVVISSSSKTSHCSGREICENRKNEDKSGKLSDLKTGLLTEEEKDEYSEKDSVRTNDKRPSICSQEVRKVLSHAEAVKKLSSSLDTQLLMTKTIEERNRPESPVPSDDGKDFTSAYGCRNNKICSEDAAYKQQQQQQWCTDCNRSDTSLEVERLSDAAVSRPRAVRSLTPNVYERPLTPTQIVVFPPEIPTTISIKSRQIRTPPSTKSSAIIAEEKTIKNRDVAVSYNNSSSSSLQSLKPDNKLVVEPIVSFERSKEIVTTSNTQEPNGQYSCEIERIKETVRVRSPIPFDMISNVKITDVTDELKNLSAESKPVSLTSLPIPKDRPGSIAAAVTIAPDRPFTPVKPIEPLYLQKPVPLPEQTVPYDSSYKDNNNNNNNDGTKVDDRPMSPLVKALSTASDRSYSPLPTECSVFLQKPKQDENKEKRVSMSEALSIAPNKPYCLPKTKVTPAEIATVQAKCTVNDVVETVKFSDKSETKLKPLDDPSIILRRPNLEEDFNTGGNYKKKSTSEEHSTYDNYCQLSSVSEELKQLFEKSKQRSSSVLSGKAMELTRSSEVSSKPGTKSKHPYTGTGLHKATTVPYYQQCVEELSAKNNKSTPCSSSRSTPIPIKYAGHTDVVGSSRKSTPLSFQAKVYVEQRKFPTSAVPSQTGVQSTDSMFVKQNISSSTATNDSVSSKSKFENNTSANPFATSGISKILQPSTPFFSEKIIKKEIATTNEGTSKGSKEAGESLRTRETGGGGGGGNKKWEKIVEEEIDRSICVKNVDVKEEMVEKLSITFPTSSSINVSSSTLNFSSDNNNHNNNNNNNNAKFGTGTSTAANSSTGTSLSAAAIGVNLSNVVAQLTQNLAKLSSSISTGKSQVSSSSSSLSCSNIHNKKPVCTTLKLPLKSSSEPKPTGGGSDGIASGPGFRGGSSAGYTAPRRGKGVLNQQNLTPGARIPLCAHCNSQIRGPFVTALGKIWCPEHFVCVNQTCHRSLMDIGFVEEPSGLYCEYCFEQYLAPACSKCAKKIKGDCLNAIGKHFHPECFTCAYCGKLFGNSPFFLEEGLPYCENDWNELFTTKCFACGFPIEAGDRWVEALNNNYHSPCFNCTMCKVNLEGQSFYAKGGRPFCKNHAR